MEETKQIPITDRMIPGITWKVILSVIGATAGVMIMYFTLMTKVSGGVSQSKVNFELLSEMKEEKKQSELDKKESDRVVNIRLTAIELNQFETKIRLTNFETKMSK